MNQKIIIVLIQFLLSSYLFAQNNTELSDEALKEKLYIQNKETVLNYTFKNFDSLFLDYLAKENNKNYTFTREEFYTFTVKIATFSERLAKLYPNRKTEAESNQKEWLTKTYDDYLKNHPKNK